MLRRLLLTVLLTACGRSAPPPPTTASGSAPTTATTPTTATSDAHPAGDWIDPPKGNVDVGPLPSGCVRQPFAESTTVPEASGAAWITIDGKAALVVIADSGNDGDYGIVDADTGATLETGKLPLGGPGDDHEGIAVRKGTYYTVTSPGWIRAYQRDGKAFKLVDGPYPLGPVDLDEGKGKKPPKSDGMVCPQDRMNCGRNYEGLCLVPDGVANPSTCIGFVAAKADGHLYCVIDSGGKLAVDKSRSIEITRPKAMADCAFADDGRLLVGSNLFDLARVYRVDGWQDPATAKVVELGQLGVGFPETIAAKGDVIYRMSDAGGTPSLMAKYRCK